MPDMSTLGVLAIVLIAAGIAFTILWIVGRLGRHDSRDQAPPSASGTIGSTFLFQNSELVDQDSSPLSLPCGDGRDVATWAEFREWLDGRFGTLPDDLAALPDTEAAHFSALGRNDDATLSISKAGSAYRVILTDVSADATALHQGHVVQTTLARFTKVLHEAPCAVRIASENGDTLWQNDLFSRFGPEDAKALLDAAMNDTGNRVRIASEGNEERQFELLAQKRDGISVLYATDVTKVAQAERVRREFVQTLTKTFANLTTGLAVFDRQKQLALFNPALLDLTGLPAAFLSGRPTLTQVFDRLRDRKVLPEPKNYCDWRDQINDMVASAADGLYLEDWSLPNGLTYRVTGRPHPDGAIAFLFEDISDEITLTRRFRSQLDLRQAVLDTMDKAIAVIAANNVVVLCNRACSDFLGIDLDSSFADMSLGDFIAACDNRLPLPTVWAMVENKISARQPTEHVLRGPDGIDRRLRAQPLSGNAVMISIESAIAAPTDRSVTLPA